MISPDLEPRIEEPDDFARYGVHAGKIWSLVKVAVMTGKREVRELVTTSMLLCDDVLDMEAEERVGCLGEAAVLTLVVRASPNCFAGAGIHQSGEDCARILRALAWRTAMNRLART
jgi:hypothetical protein